MDDVSTNAASAAEVTVEFAESALSRMEARRGENPSDDDRLAARIAESTALMNRPDLTLRARLITADCLAWSGDYVRALREFESIGAEAHRSGDPFIRARSEFLSAAARQALGDIATSRMHAIGCVDFLGNHTPAAIRIDHTMMLAATYGADPAGCDHYERALQLAIDQCLPRKVVAIHNNLAYLAWQRNDIDRAVHHVEQLLAVSKEHSLPLDPMRRDTVAQVWIALRRYDDALEIVGPVISGDEPHVPAQHAVLYAQPEAVPKCLLAAATAHRLLGDTEAASDMIDRTFAMAATQHLPHAHARALAAQAKLYASQGDFKRAYEQHIVFHDAITALHTQEQSARAQTVKRVLDADDKRRDVERFRELAMRDALTGLYNRRFVDDQLARLTDPTQMTSAPLSAAIADADLFKRINDQFSHSVGDEVLRTIAQLLSANVVAPETVGRIGGEEFVILMPGTTAHQAHLRCERLRRVIAEFDWRPLTGDLPVTISIGIATAPTGLSSPDALLAGADHHLYAAKRSGRNRVIGDSL